jgi:hypothetical protein
MRVKTGKQIIISAFVLAVSTTGISLPAFAAGETAGKENLQVSSLNSPERPATLSRSDLNSITAKVVAVDISVDKEQKSYIVRCLGSLTNRSSLILKNIKLVVQLMDMNKNMIEEIPLDYIDRAEPGQELPFKIEKFVNTKSSPYEIRAKAEVAEAEKTDMIEIAQWFMEGEKSMLRYWDIPFKDQDFTDGTTMRVAALKVLSDVSPYDVNYQKAMNMVDEIRYTQGLLDISSADYANAFMNLVSLNPENNFSGKAEQLLDIYRPQAIFEKAKSYYPQKNYYKAISLFRTIPAGNPLYFEAQKEIKKLGYMLGKSIPKMAEPDIKGYSEDQVKVLQLMESKPEQILNNTPFKNHSVWVFSDFSHFNFDEAGNLIKYRVYPLN